MKPRDVEKIILKDGWVYMRTNRSHKQYEHPIKKGKATIPWHNKDLHIKTLISIEKPTGLKLR